jgi:hypothetical protein
MAGKEKVAEYGKTENMIPVVRTAKDHFISSAYGKFDLIQGLIPAEILLYSKPRIIKKFVCEKFGILKSDINNDTFWSWLRRIKKKEKGNISLFKTTLQYTEQLQNGEPTLDWKNFTPSKPLMEIEAEQTIIKLVTETE